MTGRRPAGKDEENCEVNAVLKWSIYAMAIIGLLIVCNYFYFSVVANKRVTEELLAQPGGDRARKVMLLNLPSGRQIPVNYLLEEGRVYAGADGGWWRELDGADVTVIIRGETLTGRAFTVLDDPAYTADVFSRLRPTVPTWLPDWMNGKLVEITLDMSAP